MRFLGKTWISAENSILQNVLGICLAVPLVIIAVITTALLFPFNRPSNLSASEVKVLLKDFLEDKGGDLDFGEFLCVPIADQRLEAIRRRAANIELPLNEEGTIAVRQLLNEVEGLCPKPNDPSQ